MSAMYMPGATAVGITYDEGVVFASERRIAYGNFLVSKTTKKTFSITPKAVSYTHLTLPTTPYV